MFSISRSDLGGVLRGQAIHPWRAAALDEWGLSQVVRLNNYYVTRLCWASAGRPESLEACTTAAVSRQGISLPLESHLLTVP